MTARSACAVAAVAAVAAFVPTTGLAAGPIAGCPANGNPQDPTVGVDGWALLSIDDAVQRTIQQIPDGSFEAIFGPGVTKQDVIDARTAWLEGRDNNGDGFVCLSTQWGDGLNPKSHWAASYADLLENPSEVESFTGRDNNSQGDNHKG